MLETIFPNHLPSIIGYYIWKTKMVRVNKEYIRRAFFVMNDFCIKIYIKNHITSKKYDYTSIKRRTYNYRDLTNPDMCYRLIRGSHSYHYLPFRYYYTNGTYAKDYIGYSQNY